MRARILVAAAILFAACLAVAPSGAHAAVPSLPGPIPLEVLATLSPEEIRVLKDAYDRRVVTPEAQRVLEANPDLLQYVPPEFLEILRAAEVMPEGVETAEGTAPDNAARARRRRAAGIRAIPEGLFAAPPRYDWKKSVYVSRLFRSRLGSEESAPLVHFGHALFDPREDGTVFSGAYPVPEDYLIGPGDEVVVRLWGRVEETHRLRVDREGKIFFPKLGPMYVAGKTYDELKRFLREKTGAIAEARSDISLGRVTGFHVSVLGEVEVAGRFHVSSFNTVLQAIERAGGIKDIGSLRRVVLKRGGEIEREIDIYDFLLKGDVVQDIRLRSGDAVFVPVVGPLVAVVGEVRRQAIYELKEERTVGDVIAMSGGLSPSAFRRRLQVERLEGHLSRIVLDLSLEEAESSSTPLDLKDGDILRILAILPEDENVIRVAGNVHRPGKYEWKPGLTVGSLIPDEKFFLPDTFLDYALVTRLAGPERRTEAIPIDLRKIVIERDPAADLALEPRDTLTVHHKDAFRERRRATVGGEVRRAGEYEILPGMRVSDLVKLGGDLTRNASLEEAELSRRDEQRKVMLLTIDLGKALAGEAGHDLPIEDGDILMVKPVPDLQEIRLVTLAGEVRSPGIYAARKGERLSSILRRAGGYTEAAFLKGAVYTRVSVQQRQQEVIDRTVADLEQDIARRAAEGGEKAFGAEDIAAERQILEARRALVARLKEVRAQGRIILRLREVDALEGTMDDLVIENGDRLEIPRKAEVVNVLGRVYNPTAVVYDSSRDTAGYYLRKVGGPTEDADRKHIFVVKTDGSVVTSQTAGEGLWFFGPGDFLSTRVEPGDAIVVPERLVYPRLMKDIKDITQILYQIAVTAGVLIVAF